ncbi:phage major capsid protein [Streptomyces sp. NPDC003299]
MDGVRKLVGYAIRFNELSHDLGGFRERIVPSAWNPANNADDIYATLNHDTNQLLGRTASGTLRVSADAYGVLYEIDLPDTQVGRDVAELAKRGDLRGSSFTFRVLDGGQQTVDDYDPETGLPIREITSMSVMELGPVVNPAYPTTTAGARALENGTEMPNIDIDAARKAYADAERAEKLSADIRAAEANGEKRADDVAEIRAELKRLEVEQTRAYAALTAMKSPAETAAIGRKVSAGELLHRSIQEKRGVTVVGTGGGFTPADHNKNFIDLLAPKSVFLSSGVQRVVTKGNEWKTPVITTDFAPGFIGELESLPSGGFTAGLLTVVPKKIAASETLTNELVNDSDGLGLNAVATSMLRSVALGFDKEALSGTNASGDGFTGIANTTGIQALPVTGDPADLGPFAEAFGMLEAANAEASVIVMHPTRWAQLQGLTDSTGRQLLSAGAGSGTDGVSRSILGVPVKVSPYVDANTILVYDASQVYAVIRQDAQFTTSSDAGFFIDGIGARAIMRANIAVPNVAAVVKMSIAVA